MRKKATKHHLDRRQRATLSLAPAALCRRPTASIQPLCRSHIPPPTVQTTCGYQHHQRTVEALLRYRTPSNVYCSFRRFAYCSCFAIDHVHPPNSSASTSFFIFISVLPRKILIKNLINGLLTRNTNRNEIYT